MTRLLLLAAKRPELFQKGTGRPMASNADVEVMQLTIRKSTVGKIYACIYDTQPGLERKFA